MENQDQILAAIRDIEEEFDVRILYACESGSRAWGFASGDSDWDVRFIFVHRAERYLSLDEPTQQIDRQIDSEFGLLDISGWDILKALRLVRRHNPAVIEWVRSPIVYRATDGFHASLRSLADAHFVSSAGAYHYASIARSNAGAVLERQPVILKKYFYMLRAALAFRWAIEKRTPPPMPFQELLDEYIEPDSTLYAEIAELLQLKARLPELGAGSRRPALHAFLTSAVAAIQEELSVRPDPRPDAQQQNAALNDLFRRTIRGS